jgi:integrase
MLAEAQGGTWVDPGRLTVGHFLERWLEDYARQNVAPKTLETYTEFIRLHISPALGHHQISKLQPLQIQEYYALKLRSGRRDGKGGLAPRSVLHHHRLLKTAFKHAVHWQLIARNPCDAVKPPRPAEKEMGFLTTEETARLLQTAKGTRLFVPVLLAASTGMRRGELLGLRWQDVDLDAGTLQVSQTLQRTKEGAHFKPPKSRGSRRAITLGKGLDGSDSLVMDALREHRSEQALHAETVPDYQDQGLVFAQPDGSPWSPQGFSHAFEHLIEKAGVPRVRVHDLRHSHVSQLAEQGVHIQVVSQRLGHSDPGFTMRVYGHVFPGLQEQAARGADEILRRALTSESGA